MPPGQSVRLGLISPNLRRDVKVHELPFGDVLDISHHHTSGFADKRGPGRRMAGTL